MLKRITKWDWLAIGIMLVGAGLRLYPLFVFPLDEPFRLGGLFYEFSRQIALNNFGFPETIPYYSAGGIPFAYPPLSFYVQAFLIWAFDLPLFVSINLLPPLVTLLSLPAFYWMIRQYSGDMQLALAGLFAFALLPPAFINQIEAAGLAESFGITALVLYLGFILRWKKNPAIKDTLLGGLMLGVCVLASPGSAYAATLFSIVLFIWVSMQAFKRKTGKPIGLLILIGAIGLLVSAPYWFTVMRNHGVDFFITPFLGQHQSSVSPGQIEQMLGFQPAGEYLSFIWNWLILAGLFWAVLKRNFLIVSLFAIFWLIPREGIWLVAIPAAVLAGIGFVRLLFPLFKRAMRTPKGGRPPLAPGILAIILLILVFANALFMLNVLMTEPGWYISRAQITALGEFQAEIPEDGRIITIGNIALAEWAPALLQREVLNIEYGLEWQPDELAKVQDINTALEAYDFAGAVTAITNYTDAQPIYLIAAPVDLDNFQTTIPENVSLLLVASNPALHLYLLNSK